MTFNKSGKKKLTISLPVSLIFIVLLAFLVTVFMFLLQANGVGDLLFIFKKSNYLIFVLNYLLVLFFMMLLFFIFNNIVLSVSVSSGFLLLASFVNRYKMQTRQDPFLPWDLTLGNEVFTILKSSNISLLYSALAIFLIFILFTIFLYYFIKNTKMNIYVRCGSLIFILVSFSIVNKLVYNSTKLFTSFFIMGNVYNQKDSFESKGFLYSFVYEVNNISIKKVSGYNKSDIQSFIKTFDTVDYSFYDSQKKPHVFMIMSEAFSQISNNPAINFKNHTDPLKNFNEIKKESISGSIVVPSLGGGTADTEFDVLTGLNTRHLRGIPYSYRIINKKFNSLPAIFNNLGYNNVAIHPGHEWFYNRSNVYNYFSFSKFVDITSYTDDMFKSMYVSETSTFDTIISEFENNLANSDKPFFDFCVTIQNHGPYKDKYHADTNFSTDLNISVDETNALSNYFEGVADADRELKRLVDYAKSSKEPIVIVYFGDHQPAFANDTYKMVLDVTGEPDSLDVLTTRHNTPFIIWQNEPSKLLNDFSSTVKDLNLPKDNKFSSNYLGSVLLKLLGYENIDSFFAYNFQMLEKYPVILEEIYFDSDSNMQETEKDSEMMFKFKEWEYYKLFDENKK